MKALHIVPLLLGASAAMFGLVFDPEDHVFWNRSESAPQGIYWLSGDPITKGRWVALSGRSAAAQWAASRGYIGAGWPLLKQVAAMPGDRICRKGLAVFINGQQAAEARPFDMEGRDLPSWEGCQTLKAGEVFLLSPHPSSLDGRYFGAVQQTDIEGMVRPVLVWSGHVPMEE